MSATTDKAVLRAGAAVARASRHRGPAHPETLAARRELYIARVEARARALAEMAAPLDADGVARVARVLAPVLTRVAP